MREILFRGKRIDNGKWIEGYYYKHDSVKVCFTSDDPKVKHMIAFDGSCDWGLEPPMQAVEVRPETVGQYTGLKDRNGVPIFEGDIIKIPDDYNQFGQSAGEKYQVIFRFGGFRLKPKYGRNAKGYWLEDDETVEVIGNVHDDPE